MIDVVRDEGPVLAVQGGNQAPLSQGDERSGADNTAANKHNPDPSAWVGWGGRTMDDMGNAWTDIAFMTEEQYQVRLKEKLDWLANPTNDP